MDRNHNTLAQQRKITSLLTEGEEGSSQPLPKRHLTTDYVEVRVVGFSEQKGHTYFRIQMLKKFTEEVGKDGTLKLKQCQEDPHVCPDMFKTFNDFHKLVSDLKTQNYKNLPDLPSKTILQVKNKQELERRMLQLDDFLACLMEDRLLRNSRELIRFLSLDVHCPEILVNPPSLVFQQREKPGFWVKLIHFIPRHNIIVTCMNNKKNKQALIQFFHFRNSIEDSFTLLADQTRPLAKNSSDELQMDQEQWRVAAEIRSKSFIMNAPSQKYDADCMVVSPPDVKNEPELLVDYRFHDLYFYSINFDPEWSVLTLGTSKGSLLNYFIKVGNDSPSYDEPSPQKLPIVVNDKDLSQKPDTIVASVEFEQLECQVPIYTVKQGQTNVKEFSKVNTNFDNDESDEEGKPG